MTHEKKMRELLGRLVAMTPDPPPYPEEMPLARHRDKTRLPALVFVAAAALVALLAVPLLLFTGGEDPLLGGTTTTSTTVVTTTTLSESTTTAGATTTTQPETATTQTVGQVWSQPVFLYQSPENSFVGNPALVPALFEVTPLSPDAVFTDALAAIGTDLPNGLENAVPGDVALLGAELDGDVWNADMNEAFLEGAGGLLADVTMLNQLVYTITAGSTADHVRFTVAGDPVDTYGSEGLDLTDPVGRDDFLDQLHVINVTEPIVRSDDGWLVRGLANVFEATLAVNVLDSAGNVTHEEFVTASCGSGCWGDFEFTLAPDTVVPGESSVRLFQYSAEDGSIVDAITVAIPADGVWRFQTTD